MIKDILNTANLYAEGLNHVQLRKDHWMKKHEELIAHLKEVADELNKSAAYKQGFFVDTLHAYNEDMNGTCADLPSVTFRSGDMPMLVNFRNALGEKKEYTEEGFQISFNPTVTGQILVMLNPHQNDLNKTPLPPMMLVVIDDPDLITMEDVDTILAKGMEAAFYTSFTGMGERQEQPEQGEAMSAHRPNPIGFKRYETTEKVK
jgi:hypothetical protein